MGWLVEGPGPLKEVLSPSGEDSARMGVSAGLVLDRALAAAPHKAPCVEEARSQSGHC